MKNLKRVLSLALATVMVIGMMVVGANAAFNDQKDIDYDIAVNTLVGLGVIDGMGNNTFAPNGTLTRAQAAKMVAYVKAGANENTISYYEGTTKFTDVKANHKWASGSINYCVANGIIAGMTATTYQPDAQLTGAQLAKMMLVALGYPAKSDNANQTLTGNNWQLNAIRLATEAGLFDGLDNTFAATRAITRQEACQIMYNALFQATWEISEYQNATPVYTKTGPNLMTSAFKATEGNGSDAFGRPSKTYTIKGKDPIVVAQNPLLTYTAGVKGTQLKKDLNNTAISSNGVDVIRNNGTAQNITQSAANSALNSTNVLGGNGVVLEVYTDNNETLAGGRDNPDYGKVNKIVVVATYLAKVTDVKADNEKTEGVDETALKFDVYGLKSSAIGMTIVPDDKADGFANVFESVKEGDYILVTPVGDNTAATKVISMAIPESVKGTMTASSAGKYVKVNGTQYDLAKTFKMNEATFKNECAFYLDQYGYVIGAAEVKAGDENLQYLYVNDVSVVPANWGTGVADSVRLKVTYLDGTEAILNYEIKTASSALTGSDVVGTINKGDTYFEAPNGKKVDLDAGNAEAQFTENTFASYKLNDKGEVTLTALNADKAKADTSFNSVKEKAQTVTSGGTTYYTNNETTLNVVKDGKTTTYTGIKNFPTQNFTGVKVLATLNKDKQTVTSVYVLDGTVSGPSTYALYLGLGEKTDAGQAYRFFVNGKEVSYIVSDSSKPTDPNKYYTLSVDGENATPAVIGTSDTGSDPYYKANQKIAVVGDSFVVVGSDIHYFADEYTVANIVNMNSVETDNVQKDDTVTLVFNDKDEVVAIYITAEG